MGDRMWEGKDIPKNTYVLQLALNSYSYNITQNSPTLWRPIYEFYERYFIFKTHHTYSEGSSNHFFRKREMKSIVILTYMIRPLKGLLLQKNRVLKSLKQLYQYITLNSTNTRTKALHLHFKFLAYFQIWYYENNN